MELKEKSHLLSAAQSKNKMYQAYNLELNSQLMVKEEFFESQKAQMKEDFEEKLEKAKAELEENLKAQFEENLKTQLEENLKARTQERDVEKQELEVKLVNAQEYSEKVQADLDCLKKEMEKLEQDKKLFSEQIEQ